MKISALQILFCLALAVLLGCKKRDDISGPTTPSPAVIAVDEVGISGRIYLPDGLPASNAEVDIDGKTITTNTGGFFIFQGNVSNPDRVKVTISKKGYFQYTKVLTLETNSSISGLNFYLAEEFTVATISAVTGGTANAGHASFVFQPNGFLNADGSIYQGLVTIKMPKKVYQRKWAGDNRGKTSANQDVIIDSWGAMNVLAYDDSGKILKLSKAADYTYSIGYQYIYLTTPVKFWHFNEVTALWEEGGDATLKGQTFTGTTKDLSYMQWGVPFQAALIKAQVKDKNQVIAEGYHVGVIMTEFNNVATPTVIVNSKGTAMIYVKANATLRTIIGTQCDTGFQYWNINTPAEGKSANQTFIVDLSPYLSVFQGSVEACGFQAVKGRAEYTFDDKKMITPLVNGAFKFSFLACGLSYRSGNLIIYDEQGGVIYKNDSWVIKPGLVNNLNQVSTCSKDQTGTLTVLAEGVKYTFQTPQDKIEFKIESDYSGKLYNVITASGSNPNRNFFLTYAGTSPGSYTIYTNELSIPGKSYFLTWGIFKPGNVEITKYKTGGNYVTGTFKTNTNINYSPSNPANFAEVSGTFSISQAP